MTATYLISDVYDNKIIGLRVKPALVPYSSKVAQKNKKIYEELSCYINKLFGGSSQQGIQSGCQFDPFIS
jgi:hypothetical protein